MKKNNKSYEKAVRDLYNLQKFGIKFGLSKTSNLLSALGNPHKGQKYIHVGGTNGKGSVASFIGSILEEAGLKVGLYSSPHLVRFTERFRINNEEITTEKAETLIHDVTASFAPEEPPTFFEATTAMAMTYFAQENTDIAIMEVGMGGRLDATNVITPLVSVITNISMEHQFFLGSRLLDIAGEKAGIIKEGIDLVTGATQPSVINLFESIAKKKKVPIWRLGKDSRYRTTESGLHYYGLKRQFKGLRLGLKGNYQARNAALALTAIERLEEKEIKISSQNIINGVRKTSWPGRMQIVAEKPTILLDGAHNPAAISALTGALKSGFKFRRMILVIGVMEDKEIARLIQGIVPMADYVFYTRPVYYRAAEPEVLAREAAPLGKPGKIVQTLIQALDMAKEMADPEDLIVVTGSLFTVGEALTYFDPEVYVQDVV